MSLFLFSWIKRIYQIGERRPKASDPVEISKQDAG